MWNFLIISPTLQYGYCFPDFERIIISHCVGFFGFPCLMIRRLIFVHHRLCLSKILLLDIIGLMAITHYISLACRVMMLLTTLVWRWQTWMLFVVHLGLTLMVCIIIKFSFLYYASCAIIHLDSFSGETVLLALQYLITTQFLQPVSWIAPRIMKWIEFFWRCTLTLMRRI